MKQGITNTIYKIRRSKPYQRLKYFYSSRKPFLRYFFNKSKRDNILGEKPVFIYNHIPKCGGTSFNVILNDFFSVIYDYPPHELEFECHFDFLESLKVHEEEAPNYLALKPFQAMSGHYFYNEIFLSSRFKGIYDCPRVKLISFLRDPLTHRVSLYSFGIKKGHSYVKGVELEDYILGEKNYYSKLLECNIDNYKERLDSYFFIGIMEEFNRSIELLSNKMRMKVNRSIPNINRSNSEKYYGMLSEEIKQEFKSSNHLDYLIYEYSIKLFNR